MAESVSAIHRTTMSLTLNNTRNSSYRGHSNPLENFQKRYVDLSFLNSHRKLGLLRQNSDASSRMLNNLPEGLMLEYSFVSVSTSNHVMPLISSERSHSVSKNSGISRASLSFNTKEMIANMYRKFTAKDENERMLHSITPVSSLEEDS